MGFSDMGFSDYKLLKAIDELERQALADAQQGEMTRFVRKEAEAAKARVKARKAWDWAEVTHYHCQHLAAEAFGRACSDEADACYFEVEVEEFCFASTQLELLAEWLPSNRAKLGLEIDAALKLVPPTYEELTKESDAVLQECDEWIID
jgi:hypothetical protein